jgi:hypothetical protein
MTLLQLLFEKKFYVIFDIENLDGFDENGNLYYSEYDNFKSVHNTEISAKNHNNYYNDVKKTIIIEITITNSDTNYNINFVEYNVSIFQIYDYLEKSYYNNFSDGFGDGVIRKFEMDGDTNNITYDGCFIKFLENKYHESFSNGFEDGIISKVKINEDNIYSKEEEDTLDILISKVYNTFIETIGIKHFIYDLNIIKIITCSGFYVSGYEYGMQESFDEYDKFFVKYDEFIAQYDKSKYDKIFSGHDKFEYDNFFAEYDEWLIESNSVSNSNFI